jgi:hypothetical protein
VDEGQGKYRVKSAVDFLVNEHLISVFDDAIRRDQDYERLAKRKGA